MKKLVFLSTGIVLAAGVAFASASAATQQQPAASKFGQAICKVSPDRQIMKCTYVGKDAYGNSIY